MNSSDKSDFNNDNDQNKLNNAKEPKIKEVASKGKKKKIPALLASILKKLLIKKLMMSYVFAKF